MLPLLIGAGATVAGGILGGRAANKQAALQNQLIQQEMQRRNQIQQLAMPSILRGLGYANPSLTMGRSGLFPKFGMGANLGAKRGF